MLGSQLLALVGTAAGLVLAWVVAGRYAGRVGRWPLFAGLSTLVVLAALDQTSGGLIQRVLGWAIAQVQLVLLVGGLALAVWLVYDELTDDDVRVRIRDR